MDRVERLLDADGPRGPIINTRVVARRRPDGRRLAVVGRAARPLGEVGLAAVVLQRRVVPAIRPFEPKDPDGRRPRRKGFWRRPLYQS